MPQERRGPVLCLLLGREERQRAEEADSGVVILGDRMTAPGAKPPAKGFRELPHGEGLRQADLTITGAMAQVQGIRMKSPARSGGFVRTEIIEPLGLSVTDAARALGRQIFCFPCLRC